MSDIALLTALGGAILFAATWWYVWRLQKRLAQALGGSTSESIEHNLATYYDRVKKQDDSLVKLTAKVADLALQAAVASQKISVVRFNPFGDTGGDQSFSLAVLDAQNSGYVITSIHGREGTRVYIKPVDYGKSKYKLSVEEQQALKQAAKRVPKEE